MRAEKAQARLCVRTVSSGPSMITFAACAGPEIKTQECYSFCGDKIKADIRGTLVNNERDRY